MEDNVGSDVTSHKPKYITEEEARALRERFDGISEDRDDLALLALRLKQEVAQLERAVMWLAGEVSQSTLSTADEEIRATILSLFDGEEASR